VLPRLRLGPARTNKKAKRINPLVSKVHSAALFVLSGERALDQVNDVQRYESDRIQKRTEARARIEQIQTLKEVLKEYCNPHGSPFAGRASDDIIKQF
jgi:hypothetical protein